MDNLRFGTTARRKALRRRRARRLALLGWLVSTLAVFVGAPATRSTAIDVLEQATFRPRVQETEAAVEIPLFTPIDDDHRPPPRAAALGELRRRLASDPTAVVAIIEAAATRAGVDGDYLVSMAECESGFDPRAYNSAGYYGLFQYDESTWEANGEGSIWDPAVQARTNSRRIVAG